MFPNILSPCVQPPDFYMGSLSTICMLPLAPIPSTRTEFPPQRSFNQCTELFGLGNGLQLLFNHFRYKTRIVLVVFITGHILMNGLCHTTTFYTGIVLPDSGSHRVVCSIMIALSDLLSEQVLRSLS